MGIEQQHHTNLNQLLAPHTNQSMFLGNKKLFSGLSLKNFFSPPKRTTTSISLTKWLETFSTPSVKIKFSPETEIEESYTSNGFVKKNKKIKVKITKQIIITKKG